VALPWRSRVAAAFAVPGQVLGVAVALLVLGSALWFVPSVGTGPSGVAHDALRWPAVAALTAVCELVVVHLQVHREAHALSLSELAIVLGLFFATPGEFVLGRMLGALPIFVFWRRQSAAKVVFNSALYLAESTLALAVFGAIRGSQPGIHPRTWVAVCAACVGVGVLASIVVSLMIALIESGLQVRALLAEAARGAVSSCAVAAVGLVPAYALSVDREAAVPLVLWLLLLLLAYRAYSGLAERHLSLERLHRFSRALGSSPEVDGVLVDVLEHAREVLRGEHAEVVFLAPDRQTAPVRVHAEESGRLARARLSARDACDPVWSTVIGSAAPVLIPRGTREPAMRDFLDRHGLREAVLAPLSGDSGTIGTILVGNRMGQVRGFDDQDARLLMTVASQTAMALRHGQLVDRIAHDAVHDPLTGLPNRAQATRTLTELLISSPGGGPPAVTVMIVDLVGFKNVNNTLGMALGDNVLREIAARITAALSGHGTLARLESDEFAALLPGIGDRDSALDAVQLVRQAMQPPVRVEGIDLEVGAWIGISMAPADGTEAAPLLQRADAAMHEAKLGSIGWHVYDPQLQDDGARDRLALVAQLRRGIAEGELELYVQPQAQLRTGRIVAVEALVRWRHPLRGLVYPDEFIPLAERCGLVRPLTSAVLELAITQMAQWRRTGLDLAIAVNLSARSTITDDIVEEVAELLHRHEVPASSLVLEITEGSVIRDPTRTRAVLERLNALGTRLSVDDFGTGYATLSYLRELPVHEVKIDRSFVWTMLSSPQDEAIVRSIVDLAANLRLTVVAEGVEDAATLQALTAMGCDLVQGYHLARPMPIADFPSWLRSWQRQPPVPGPRHPGQPARTG
jgi:diguanylate cyclase (GGDEF)-like protein